MVITSRRENNPYVGPRALKNGERIYGRDNERLELLDLLVAERIVLLCSPSGAGKSSLIEAGLRQELIEEGFDVLPTARVNTPLPSGIELPPECNRYVFSVLHSLQDEKAAPGKDVPAPGELPRMSLKEYLDLGAASDSSQKKVLILDQFEEILTLNPTDIEGKREFFAQLGAALHDRRRWALFSMREEFLGALNPHLPSLPTRLSVKFRLDLLKEDAAREAIQKTASDAGVEFTDEAAIKLVNDLRRLRIQGLTGTAQELAGPYVEPVQLQVVCSRLWEELPEDKNIIDVAEVEKSGTVDTALGDYYFERVAEIARDTKVSERIIRDWFGRRLITAQGIRGQVLKGVNQSDGLDNEAIKGLVRVHLVREEERLNATWYELAHDRLIEPVLKNNESWYQKNLNILQLSTAEWYKHNRPAALLLRDKKLVEAEQWAAEHGQEMTKTEGDYLTSCRAALSPLQRQSISWKSQGGRPDLLLQKQSLIEAERWAVANQSELTEIDRNFLEECRSALSPLQRKAIIWEVQQRKSDYLLRGRQMIEAKRWADEHGDQLSYIDRDFLAACQLNLSPLQQQALMWESQSRAKKFLLDGVELLNAIKWASENSSDLTRSENDFLEAGKEAEKRREEERQQAERERKLMRRIRILGIVSLIIGAIAVLGAYLTLSYSRDLDKTKLEIALEAAENKRSLDAKDTVIKDVRSEKQGYDKFVERAGGEAKQVIEQALQADKQRQQVAKPEDQERRRSIKLMYFPYDVNQDLLIAALQELGFNTLAVKSKNLDTNSIWYGSEVCKHMEDVQLVAYTLMRAGVQIKLIQQLDNSAGRERTIIVGGNTKREAANARPMTVDDIAKLKSTPCNP